MNDSELIFWHPGLPCCNERWEAAYNRFETPEEERTKFAARFNWLGIDKLNRDARIVDLFCGRGNGLRVLENLGFDNLAGVDLSADLLGQSPASTDRYVGDCTDLKFESESIDAFIVQGGLHHLPRIPEDLDLCLASTARCLKPGGFFFIAEPWLTPYLKIVHTITAWPVARKCVSKFDAFATMVEEEIETYQNWLGKADQIRSTVTKYYTIEKESTSKGKWMAVLKKKS